MESEEYGDDSKAEHTLVKLFYSRALHFWRPYRRRTKMKRQKIRALDQPLIRWSDVFNCVPTYAHSSDKALCYVSCTRVND